ncbi:MAG: hypothetical protein H6968_11565 [Chromatiaceae bacterium]|nr:hypothetical protein [Chromatiaceae bacterium]
MKVSVPHLRLAEVVYTGKKEELVAAGIADEEDFPVWPKRYAHSGTDPRCHTWSIRYIRGGSFEVTHSQVFAGAEDMLPFVSVVDGRRSYWMDDPKMDVPASVAEQEMAIGQLYFLAYMRYLRQVQSRGVSICGHRLLARILEDMPESSWRVYGFMSIADSFLFAAARYLDTDQEERRIKAALLADGTEKAA